MKKRKLRTVSENELKQVVAGLATQGETNNTVIIGTGTVAGYDSYYPFKPSHPK
jgi:hypothetical protein